MIEEQKEKEDKEDSEEHHEAHKPATLSSALAAPDTDDRSPTIATKSGKHPSDYNVNQSQVEAVRFVKGSGKARRSPKPQSKFCALGTIDEAVNETATSMMQDQSIKDDESKLGSNNLRSSNQIDFEESNASNHKESMNKVDLLNRSLSGTAGSKFVRHTELSSDGNPEPESRGSP